jgi:hypothetical protein
VSARTFHTQKREEIIMTRFVRNPDGAVHSVPDDFEFPKDADGKVIGKWEEATEADASPALLGQTPDPQVVANELHNLAEQPVPEVVSSGYVGDDPEAPMTADEIARVEATAASPEQTPEPAPAEPSAPATPEEAVQ